MSEVAIRAPDGGSIVGTYWPPQARPRALVLLVHGLKDHTLRYGEFAEELVSGGFAVLGYDLRGHGRSGGPRVWVRQFNDYLSDLEVAIADGRRRHPEAPLYLFGHSMGGAIATLYAMEHPDRLQGLVVSAPAIRPGGNVSGFTIAFTKFLGSVAPHAAVFKIPNPDFSRDPAVVASMTSDPLIYQRPGPARTAAQLLLAMERIRGSVPRLTVPLLNLHGTMDRLTNPRGSQELYDAAGSTDKKLILYPGLYHDLLHEPEHPRVAADIVGWLRVRTTPEVGTAT